MSFWWCLALLLGSVAIYRAHECDVFTDLDLHHSIIGTSLYVKLLLYTRANLICGQELSHHNLSAQPLFNVTKPTTFIVHGYRPTGSPPVWIHDITQQLLARGDMNVLLVDWNRGATNVNYLKVVTYTHDTADNLTAFIKKMQENGASLSSIHMIGISLGAHISGFVGAKFNGTIGRITALDPAGPMFTGNPPEDRLDPTDAQFVDVVHTDMDAFGFRKPLGHIDFYPNGGADQPGCPKTIFSGSSYFKCDHQRSVFLYLGSINRTCNIRAFPCSSYTEFLDGRCMDCDQFKPAGCPVFGYDSIEWKDTLVPLNQTRAFFTTNKQTPFCSKWTIIGLHTHLTSIKRDFLGILLCRPNHEAATTMLTVGWCCNMWEKSRGVYFEGTVHMPSPLRLCVKSLFPCVILHECLTSNFSYTFTVTHRPLCRYDVILEENKELTFRPMPCEESNF
ncbi:unnamed protein product [Oncorhynchus mykiss]|uniref:Lipase domain-containing protein n=1 Tax=Oncorhynchus mykiss TaxID=8022 RepID=A0A060WRG1_ONCMY|nr:unnamed protein product [Oncorhynchus mykiss]